MVFNVTVAKTTTDPAGLWNDVHAVFGHVDDDPAGKMYGMSTGDYGIRLHFAEMPSESDLDTICAMFEVETVTCEEE